MKKKYFVLKYVNRKHSLFSRYFLGFNFSLIIFLISGSTSLAQVTFSDFYHDDFKLGIRRALKLLNIYIGIKLVKDETFNFCENMTKNGLMDINSKFHEILKSYSKFTTKGEYLYVISSLIEIEQKKQTKLIDEFNKFSQEIIDHGNKIFKREGVESLNKTLKIERKGDFDIEDALLALADWNRIFSKERYKWFVISGTFLGLIREGGFLKHDYDIDFGIFYEDLLLDEIENKIHDSEDFVIRKIDYLYEGVFKNDSFISNNEKKPVLLKIIHKTGLNIDLFIHYVDENIIWHGSSYHRWENKIFKLKTYLLHNLEVFGPENWDLYLTENYGDWRTPVTNFHFNTGTPNLSIVKNPTSIAMFVKRISEFRSRKSYLKNKYILNKLNILSEKGIFDLRFIEE